MRTTKQQMEDEALEAYNATIKPAFETYRAIDKGAWESYKAISVPAYEAYKAQLKRINTLPDNISN